MTMNSHYLEIKAILQADITQSEIMAHIMQTLHHYLPAYRGRIGASFPAYGQNRSLGGILRLFADEASLKQLHYDLEDDDRFSHYALLDNIAAVPQKKIHSHARFRRHQQKGNSDLKRAAKRLAEQGVAREEIAARLAAKAAKIRNPQLPHLHLHSASTRCKFILNIKREYHVQESDGVYNTYGLSLGHATVPLF